MNPSGPGALDAPKLAKAAWISISVGIAHNEILSDSKIVQLKRFKSSRLVEANRCLKLETKQSPIYFLSLIQPSKTKGWVGLRHRKFS